MPPSQEASARNHPDKLSGLRRSGGRRPVTLGCMRGAGDTFSVGERIAFYRRRRGLTQRVLASMVGRSEDWLSKIERNERDLRRLDVLTDLARELRVTLGDLLGQPVLVEDDQPAEDNVPAVREALMSHRRLSRTLFGGGTARSVDLIRAAQLTEYAWQDYQNGRLGRVIKALPGLITTAQALEDEAAGADQGQTWRISARVHHLAASLLSKIGEADLAWIAAERAMSAAERSGDPLSLASAARAGTHALLSVGRYDDALNLGETAASWLEANSDANDPEALSLAGMLRLRTAVAAARHQDRALTNELLRRADDAAERIGRDADYWFTSFGPTNVRLHRLSASLDLDDVAYVIEHGHRVTAVGLPAERSATLDLDMARAYSYAARDDDALTRLLDAEHKAPQLVHHSASARETVKTLHRRAKVSNPTLTALASRCRATT
jgi:transcriptional regulator with XRE-family HTH domain